MWDGPCHLCALHCSLLDDASVHLTSARTPNITIGECFCEMPTYLISNSCYESQNTVLTR